MHRSHKVTQGYILSDSPKSFADYVQLLLTPGSLCDALIELVRKLYVQNVEEQELYVLTEMSRMLKLRECHSVVEAYAVIFCSINLLK